MPKKEKIGLLTLIIVAIIIVLIIFIAVKKVDNGEEESTPAENTATEEFVKVLDGGIKLNTSGTFSKTKKVDGLEISNIQLTYNNGISTVLADVKNTTDVEVPSCELIIKFYDKKDNVIITLPGYIDAIPAGQTRQLNTSVTADFANAYDFTVEKK